MFRLPPTESSSLHHFRILHILCELLLCLALARVPLALSKTRSYAGLQVLLHIASAVVMVVALSTWIFHPSATGNASSWSAAALTCDCSVMVSSAASWCVVGAVSEVLSAVVTHNGDQPAERLTETEKRHERLASTLMESDAPLHAP